MALPTGTPAPSPGPQVVGNAFVEQYYHILHQSPESVYKFYQESSILSRPNPNGMMTPVTTTQAINELVLSLDYKDYIAEILTVDSQPSYNGGVFILVTGSLIGQDKIRRKFTESFFLVPQDKGVYFVLNDIFRFVDENQSKEFNQMLVNGSDDNASKAPSIPDPELASVQNHLLIDPATPPSEGFPENGDGTCSPLENGDAVDGDAVDEHEVSAVDPPVQLSDTQPVSEALPFVVQEDVPKKSYASIVKVMKGSTSPAPVYVPTIKSKPVRVNTEKPLTASTTPLTASTTPLTASTTPAPASVPAPEPSATGSNSVSEKNDSFDEGHSIYIRNLPLNATAEQIEKEFKKFGPIKPGGVQVRGHKLEHFCFGFVEFESIESMQAAIKASPITIAGRQAFIEEKRTTTRVINGVVTNSIGIGRGWRFPPGRGGGFRNDNFRERGGFGNNQVFGRSDFRNRAEYSGRGRGQGYQQRFLQSGYGRMGRPSAMNQAVTA